MRSVEHGTRCSTGPAGIGQRLQPAGSPRRLCSGSDPARVVAVVSDRADARALQRADHSGIPDVHVGKRRRRDTCRLRRAAGRRGQRFPTRHVVLLGWMRILTMSFLGWFPGMVVNLHPALPGELPGTDAIERAFAESQRGRAHDRPASWCTSFPTRASTPGPCWPRTVVPIDASTTRSSRSPNAIHDAEHHLLVATLATVCGTPVPKEINA